MISFTKMTLISTLLLSISNVANTGDETDFLERKCINSFKIIENKNYALFLKELPSKEPSKHEVSYSRGVLDRAYERWFVRSKFISAKVESVVYSEPSKRKVKRYKATNQIDVRLNVVTNKRTKRAASCKFIKIENSWYLSKLP